MASALGFVNDKGGKTILASGNNTETINVTLPSQGGTLLTSDETYLIARNNLSDLTDVAAARQNLQLGSAATNDVGVGANDIVQLDGSGKLPAVDGSQLTNISVPASASVRAWVNFNGSGTPSIRASYNVSSITLISGGYTLRFANNLSDANYGMAGATIDNAASIVQYKASSSPSTSGFDFNTINTGGGFTQASLNTIIVYGN